MFFCFSFRVFCVNILYHTSSGGLYRFPLVVCLVLLVLCCCLCVAGIFVSGFVVWCFVVGFRSGTFFFVGWFVLFFVCFCFVVFVFGCVSLGDCCFFGNILCRGLDMLGVVLRFSVLVGFGFFVLSLSCYVLFFFFIIYFIV